ncbi:MAG: hypothetical protein ACRCYX_14340 [Dermatophilaceae bacterium]
MTVQASLEALEHDAPIWDEVSAEIGAAGATVGVFALSGEAVSWMAGMEGFLDLYDEVRTLVATLLEEGAATTAAIGNGLRQVRRQYQDDDAAARARFRGVWESK